MYEIQTKRSGASELARQTSRLGKTSKAGVKESEEMLIYLIHGAITEPGVSRYTGNPAETNCLISFDTASRSGVKVEGGSRLDLSDS